MSTVCTRYEMAEPSKMAETVLTLIMLQRLVFKVLEN